MKVLELFAGSRSIGKVADELGYEVFSIDINNFDKIDLVKDIEFVVKNDIPFIPDVIWASPPCTTYSIAAIGHHRDMGKPKTEFAAKSDRLVLNTLNLIKEFDCKYFIENPRGYMRKMLFMKGLPRTTVWYCRYGDKAAKPTDIWSNHIYSLFNSDGWQPRQECFNGNKKCHHESAPRGTTIKKLKNKGIIVKKGGTQAKKNNYERSKIPYELCKEILLSI
jgi:site-specific DNA-cytosine methylase